jgi:hypothetical protein
MMLMFVRKRQLCYIRRGEFFPDPVLDRWAGIGMTILY